MEEEGAFSKEGDTDSKDGEDVEDVEICLVRQRRDDDG